MVAKAIRHPFNSRDGGMTGTAVHNSPAGWMSCSASEAPHGEKSENLIPITRPVIKHRFWNALGLRKLVFWDTTERFLITRCVVSTWMRKGCARVVTEANLNVRPCILWEQRRCQFTQRRT